MPITHQGRATLQRRPQKAYFTLRGVYRNSVTPAPPPSRNGRSVSVSRLRTGIRYYVVGRPRVTPCAACTRTLGCDGTRIIRSSCSPTAIHLQLRGFLKHPLLER